MVLLRMVLLPAPTLPSTQTAYRFGGAAQKAEVAMVMVFPSARVGPPIMLPVEVLVRLIQTSSVPATGPVTVLPETVLLSELSRVMPRLTLSVRLLSEIV